MLQTLYCLGAEVTLLTALNIRLCSDYCSLTEIPRRPIAGQPPTTGSWVPLFSHSPSIILQMDPDLVGLTFYSLFVRGNWQTSQKQHWHRTKAWFTRKEEFPRWSAARPLPFPPTRIFSHTCKIPSSFQSQTQSKTPPPLKAKLLIPPLTFCMEFLQPPSSPCCTSRSFPEKKPLTQRKCKADGFSTYVQGGRRERMKFWHAVKHRTRIFEF